VPRDKRAKFVELAEARTERALHTIRLLANLANRNNYEYTDADVAKIVNALEGEIRLLKARFRTEGARKKASFRL
jgi:hypothetical protein